MHCCPELTVLAWLSLLLPEGAACVSHTGTLFARSVKQCGTVPALFCPGSGCAGVWADRGAVRHASHACGLGVACQGCGADRVLAVACLPHASRHTNACLCCWIALWLLLCAGHPIAVALCCVSLHRWGHEEPLGVKRVDCL